MRKLIYLLIIILMSCQKEQEAKSKISTVFKENTLHDEESYKVINLVLDSINNENTTNSNYTTNYVSESISMEENSIKFFKLNPKRLNNFELIPYKDLMKLSDKNKGFSFWDKYYEKYKSPFYTVSKPVFNLKKNKSFVECNLHCGGLCGEGKSIWLIFNGKKWTITKIQMNWVS